MTTTVSLGEIASFIRGVTFKPTDVNGDGVGVMRTKNVQESLDLSDILRIPPSLVKREEQYLREGDTLISSANSWNAVGRACWVPNLSEPLAIGGFVTALRPKSPSVYPRYLYRWLTSPRTQTTLRSFGNKTTNISNLNLKLTAQLPVPLPPFDEQRRIAAILDQADSIRTKRHRALTHLDALKLSTFDAMYGNLSPKDVTFGDVAEVQGGLQVTAMRASLPVSAPYLRVANVHRGRLDLSEIKTINVTAAELERTRLRAGDLLFVEGHANPMEIGRVALWDGSIEGCTHQNHLIRGRLDPGRCDPIFAEQWLNSRVGAAHFRRAGKTTSGLNTISAKTVRSAPMLTPPLDHQEEFASRIKAISAKRSLVARALAADDELFASLQSRAFRGEL